MDAYDESEQMVGFYTMLEENLATQFATKLLGVEVTVERLEMTNLGHFFWQRSKFLVGASW